MVAARGVCLQSGSVVSVGRAEAVRRRAPPERSNLLRGIGVFGGKLNNSTRIRLSDSKIGMYIGQYLYILVL